MPFSSPSAQAEGSLRTNLAVSLAAKITAGILNFGVAPIYARLIGIEGFGLIGIYLTVQGMLQILEVGLTTAASRELARHTVQTGSAHATREFVRSIETAYWVAAAVLTAGAVLLSTTIVRHWIRLTDIPPNTAAVAVAVMLVTIALQWPGSLYFGGLMGMQRQVTANMIVLGGTVLRVAASLAVLTLVSRSVTAFFLTQAAVTAIATVVMASALWRILPPGQGAVRIRLELLKKAMGLSAGISAVSLLTTFLNQVDKVVVSRQASLAEFGYYMLAWTFASTVYMLVTPVAASVFPTLSRYAALDDVDCLTRLYSKSVQLVNLLLTPAAVVVTLFARETVLLWTRDRAAAEHTSMVIAVLMAPVIASAFLEIALVVQRAFGWIRVSLSVTALSSIVILPVMFIGLEWFGTLGAAISFAVIKTMMAIIQIVYTHRALARSGAVVRLYRQIVAPITACLVAVAMCRMCFAPGHSNLVDSVIAVSISLAVAYGVTAAFTPALRSAAAGVWPLLRGRLLPAAAR